MDNTKDILETLQYIVDNMATKDGLKAVEQRINIQVENDVTKRIDALFDGYKLTHEKQWELERKVDALEKRLKDLENKIA